MTGGGTGPIITDAMLKLSAVAPKISAGLSIPCSAFVARRIAMEHRRNRGGTIKRALAAMSVFDVMASTAWFLSSWMVPPTPGGGGGGALYASGNRATCTFQGFLLQIAIAPPMYNTFLACCYLLSVRYGWRDADLRRIEPYVHATITTFAVGTAVACIPLGLYNPVGNVCWIMGSPPGCGDSSMGHVGDVPCDRGDHAWVYGVALFYCPLWVCILFTTAAMAMLLHRVRQVEGRTSSSSRTRDSSEAMTGGDGEGGGVEGGHDRLSVIRTVRNSSRRRSSEETRVCPLGSSSTCSGVAAVNNRRRDDHRNGRNDLRRSMGRQGRREYARSEAVAAQALLYTTAFYVTWLPSTAWSVAHWSGNPSFWLDVLASTCEPLQGFLNFLVFLRPRRNLRGKIGRRVRSTLCCCCAFVKRHYRDSKFVRKSSVCRRNGTGEERGAGGSGSDVGDDDDESVMGFEASSPAAVTSSLEAVQSMDVSSSSCSLDMIDLELPDLSFHGSDHASSPPPPSGQRRLSHPALGGSVMRHSWSNRSLKRRLSLSSLLTVMQQQPQRPSVGSSTAAATLCRDSGSASSGRGADDDDDDDDDLEFFDYSRHCHAGISAQPMMTTPRRQSCPAATRIIECPISAIEPEEGIVSSAEPNLVAGTSKEGLQTPAALPVGDDSCSLAHRNRHKPQEKEVNEEAVSCVEVDRVEVPSRAGSLGARRAQARTPGAGDQVAGADHRPKSIANALLPLDGSQCGPYSEISPPRRNTISSATQDLSSDDEGEVRPSSGEMASAERPKRRVTFFEVPN